MERWTKRQNLMLYGVKEGDEEKWEDTRLWEDIGPMISDKPKRLGQSRNSSNHARPLRLTFVTVSAKYQVLQAAKELRTKGIRVDEAQQQETKPV